MQLLRYGNARSAFFLGHTEFWDLQPGTAAAVALPIMTKLGARNLGFGEPYTPTTLDQAPFHILHHEPVAGVAWPLLG